MPTALSSLRITKDNGDILLKLVFARSGYGKSEFVFSHIKKLVEGGQEDILLITPEQYSLVCEKKLLTELGEHGITKVDNSSFSRITDDVRRKYGSDSLPTLSKGGKAVMMMRAIELVKENLQLFNKHLDSLSFVNSMIKIYDEMKSCNLSCSEIIELSQSIESDALKRKLSDISLIMSSYEMLLFDKYLDPANELTRLYNQLNGLDYFKDKDVFIDGFNGFVAQEYKILELVIKEAKCVTITLCTDCPDNDDTFNLFGYVNNSAKILKKIALKANIEILEKRLADNKRAQNKDIQFLEKNIFSDEKNERICTESISVYSAKSITDECCEAARQIRSLLRKGYKASDIAVIGRDLNKYREELSVTFKKYEIPFFNDERQPIKNQPLVVFIEYLLRCVNFSLRSDDILSLAKTGLTYVSDEDINELENYIYLWNISGSKWTRPFENSTKGFVNEISASDKARLEKINKTREKIIAPIIKFKNAVKGADALKISASVYYTLLDFGVDKKISEIALDLSRLNHTALADEQGRVWDLVMNILNDLPQTIGEEQIKLKEYAKIFSLIISTEDLGTLPVGIDNIQIGQADRIRTDNPKAVFILGANEGEFPQTVTSGGLLSEGDRRILLENDFKLYSYGEVLNQQEKYFAYMACAAPREKLYISYLGNTGKDSAPSEIITSVESIFDITEKTYDSIHDIDLIETYSNSFELMCERYLTNTVFYSSLREYFKNDSRFSAVKALAENKKSEIENKQTAVSLFGYNMYVSASRVEDFYNCSFRYFCKFGLNARPRTKAEIDPMQRGTLIHYVLEMILSTVGSKRLSAMTDAQLKALVDKFTAMYFEQEMGSAADLSIRFRYNYRRLSKLIYSVVYHLAEEFAHSDFEANAFELDIDRDGQVKPEQLMLDDGGTIQIRGSIDRVDTYEHNGERYVRVIDYKSGNKTFNYSDIMHGLNLQMFIYLFSLCADKNAELTGIPAGVLYMHAARNIFNFDSRLAAEGAVKSEENASFKMKGIVLDTEDGEIARAMDHELMGKYIPVKAKKDGELTGKLARLEQLGYIHKKVNAHVTQMGMELHLGRVNQNPVKDKQHKNTCEYCDYKDVCANKKTIENRTLDDISDNEVLEILAKEYGENATVDSRAE